MDIQENVKKIEYLGYAVIKGVFDEEDVILPLLEKINSWHKSLTVPETGISANQALDKYVYHLQYKDKCFLDLLTESGLLCLLKPFLQDPY